jgi:hypothetical protein
VIAVQWEALSAEGGLLHSFSVTEALQAASSAGEFLLAVGPELAPRACERTFLSSSSSSSSSSCCLRLDSFQ